MVVALLGCLKPHVLRAYPTEHGGLSSKGCGNGAWTRAPQQDTDPCVCHRLVFRSRLLVLLTWEGRNKVNLTPRVKVCLGLRFASENIHFVEC